jgi:hypothetical protein
MDTSTEYVPKTLKFGHGLLVDDIDIFLLHVGIKLKYRLPGIISLSR